jgi:hypothetical protein
LAIAELARSEVDKHALVARLGDMASRRSDNQFRAIQLLLAYAFGPPSAEIGLRHSGFIGGGADLVKLREVLLVALEPFPDARVALAGRLLELETEVHEHRG